MAQGPLSRIATLLGISTYRRATPEMGAALDSREVESAREAMGGQIAPLPFTKTRWLQRDLESAQIAADAGQLQLAAQLWNAAKRDGVLAGVLSTRTGGLVRLRKKFRGDPRMIAALELGHDSVRSVFDEMFPANELALLADDGIGLGVGVAELLPVAGRDYPVLTRLPPENLVYFWSQDRWYYRSIAGMIPITPGDGRWVLHAPGGRIAPWQQGIWRAVGRAFINKEHALLMNSNWEAKLANPARVAVAPQGATDEILNTWAQRVMAWGVNTVFAMKPGFDVRLLESNGRGSDSFDRTVKRSEREYVIAVAGQEVTTDGGAGFQNSDIHKSIRSDLIQATGDGLAHTINTQGIPPWAIARWGEEQLAGSPCVEWDITPPKDRNSEAQAMLATGTAIKQLGDALRAEGATQRVDVGEVLSRQGIPVAHDEDGDGDPDDATEQHPAPAAESEPDPPSIDEVSKAIELAKSRELRPTEESIRDVAKRVGLDLEEIPEPESEPGPPDDSAPLRRLSEDREPLASRAAMALAMNCPPGA